MKTNRKASPAGRRERRAFRAEFKAEAVRMVAARRCLKSWPKRSRAGWRLRRLWTAMVAQARDRVDCVSPAQPECRRTHAN